MAKEKLSRIVLALLVAVLAVGAENPRHALCRFLTHSWDSSPRTAISSRRWS